MGSHGGSGAEGFQAELQAIPYKDRILLLAMGPRFRVDIQADLGLILSRFRPKHPNYRHALESSFGWVFARSHDAVKPDGCATPSNKLTEVGLPI